jgi:hypothetical protein
MTIVKMPMSMEELTLGVRRRDRQEREAPLKGAHGRGASFGVSE